MRAYAMGFLPIDARLARFDGTLTYDPDQPGRCTAALTAEVASLETSDSAMRENILSPDFLDGARFPTLSFVGTCTASDTADGSLTLRGVTRPLAMQLAWSAHRLVGVGHVRRALWGMEAKPMMVGPVIRIRVTAALP